MKEKYKSLSVSLYQCHISALFNEIKSLSKGIMDMDIVKQAQTSKRNDYWIKPMSLPNQSIGVSTLTLLQMEYEPSFCLLTCHISHRLILNRLDRNSS